MAVTRRCSATVKGWKKKRATSPTIKQAFVPLAFPPGETCQFDWSHETVELGGVVQTIKVAHFRLTADHVRMVAEGAVIAEHSRRFGRDHLICDPWHTMEQAYNYGNGWLSVITRNEILELSTRLVSLKHKVIGSPKITTATFNRYLNPCKECHGSGFLTFLEDNLIIENIELSILDDGFLYESISNKFKSVMRLEIKPAITKFKDEGLFDFSKQFNLLDIDEKDMFLHGFIHNKFLKTEGQ
ncbi:MAG: hypothetical protein PHW13_06030 [Methylococcales bacterium]|nr:hypothetical protein [Methylococcales bacterium]